MAKSSIKILLAAGVFFPDVGGPAIHVRKIAERLSEEGYEVTVIAYGDDPSHTHFPFKIIRVSRKQSKVLQWLKYSLLVLKHSFGADLLYSFDQTAAGIPPAIMAFILHKPYVLRIGGDPIWERQVETGKRFMPLDKYYQLNLAKKDKPFLFFLIKIILKIPRTIVVYNQNWKDFYAKYFGVNPKKIMVVRNPVFRREFGNTELPAEPTILFAGRFVSYKNLPMVIKAFKNAGIGHLELIGSGPDESVLKVLVKKLRLEDKISFVNSLPQERLFERIKNSAVCIGPALSEFNPNFILEALSFGKPVLLSRGHGLSVELPEEFLFDPLDQKDLENKLKNLLNNENYARAVEAVNSLILDQSWKDVTSAHLFIIKDILRV